MEPIKIGWLGSALDGPGGGYDKIHRLAFDEASEQGLLDRPVEFVLHPENGLPQGSAKNATDGFRYLVDEGCIGVAGAYSSDNAITVGPLANELQIPLLSWCGTERLQGDYCFRLGNGDCGGDAALVVGWLKKHGHERVAVLSEISPNGEEYFRFFRQECRRRGISIAAVETVSQSPENLAANLDNLRQVGADALVYMGYGMLGAKGLMREALDKLGWDPPRVMGTAFMFYLMGFDKFEGWVGVDQLDPSNPLVEGFHQRFVDRYGQDPPFWPNAIPVLAYDTARVLIEGLFRAPILSGPGLKAGLETIRFMPSTTGGPRTHIACSPYEHGMFRGDWLLYGRVAGGKLEFEGLFDPWEGQAHMAVTDLTGTDRYTIISVDGHAGAALLDYRPYLASKWHDEFDAWAAAYVNPFSDLLASTAYRNWDSEQRLAETTSQGVIAEVLFPNTIPPFFAQSNLTALEPTADDYEKRWAGLQAHNRWLADFCAAAPGRRAGCAQVFLNHLDDALGEVQWAKDNMHVLGGVLIPSVPPNSSIAPLWDPVYEPLWDLCEQHDVVINVHSGSGLPDYGQHEAARAIMLIELAWYAHRAVWHLIFGGVLERHPKLRVVLTEQGTSWIPRGLDTLDWFHRRMTFGGAAEAAFFGAATKGMSMTPTEYFQRNFWVGASFLRPSESPLRYEVGVDRIMWGADYPHSEGSYPYTTEALRAAFADVPPAEVKLMLETTAADVYRFDLPALREIGDRVGPTVAEVAVPLDPSDYPSDSTCNAFDAEQVIKAW